MFVFVSCKPSDDTQQQSNTEPVDVVLNTHSKWAQITEAICKEEPWFCVETCQVNVKRC